MTALANHGTLETNIASGYTDVTSILDSRILKDQIPKIDLLRLNSSHRPPYPKSSPACKSITDAVRAYADGFIAVVQGHAPANGVDPSVDIGHEVAEEWQGDGGDREGTLSVPLVQGLIS
jgi:hypothetical protein